MPHATESLLKVFENLRELEQQIRTERGRLQQEVQDGIIQAVADVNTMENTLSHLLVRFYALVSYAEITFFALRIVPPAQSLNFHKMLKLRLLISKRLWTKEKRYSANSYQSYRLNEASRRKLSAQYRCKSSYRSPCNLHCWNALTFHRYVFRYLPWYPSLMRPQIEGVLRRSESGDITNDDIITLQTTSSEMLKLAFELIRDDI